MHEYIISIHSLLPGWINDQVKSFSDIRESYFYLTLDPVLFPEGTIPLKQVCGTLSPDFRDGTWMKMIGKLKRIKRFGSIQQIRASTVYSPDKIQVARFGQEYLIVKGNHRLTLLKFFEEYESVTGEVVDHVFDHELFNIQERLKQQGFQVRKNCYNEDFPGKIGKIHWTIKLSHIRIHLEGRDQILKFQYFYNSIKTDRLSYIKYLCTRYCCSRRRYSIKFYLFEDLQRLKPELCKFKIIHAKQNTGKNPAGCM